VLHMNRLREIAELLDISTSEPLHEQTVRLAYTILQEIDDEVTRLRIASAELEACADCGSLMGAFACPLCGGIRSTC